MNDKNDPNKKHYFQPATLDEFTEVMLHLCSLPDKQLVMIWEKGETEDDAEFYEALEFYQHPKILKLNPTGKLLTKITGSLKAQKQVLIRIKVEDKINFFTGGYLKFHPEDLTYSLTIQQEIFKSQQRSNFRLKATPTNHIQFKIDDIVYDALDISVGGTSFLITKDFLEKYEKGKMFLDCTLRFDRKNYHIPMAQIAGIFSHTNDDGTTSELKKVGISFKGVSRVNEDDLYIRISTFARGEEMAKKFDELLEKKKD